MARPKPFATIFNMQAVSFAKQTLIKLLLKCKKAKSRNMASWKCQINSKLKSSNRATSTEVVICIKEAFVGGFPLPSGQKMVQVKQNFVY